MSAMDDKNLNNKTHTRFGSKGWMGVGMVALCKMD